MAIKKQVLSLSFIIILFFLVSTFEIDKIPGEWYGDISIVNNYVINILSGKFPYTFFLSAGPVYHYLISPFIYVLGINYVSYKLASIYVGVLGIIATYLFAKEITSSSKIGLLTSYITAISFWFFVFSRLGNSQIVIPVLTALLGYSVIAYQKNKKNRYIILGIAVASLGLFTYPQTFVLPPLYFLLMFCFFLQNKKLKTYWKTLVSILIGFIPAVLFFIFIIHAQPNNFSNGYVGSKIPSMNKLLTPELLTRVFYNIYRTAGMLHFEGDIIFRHNVRRTPHVDSISGILFLVGLIFLFLKRRRYFLYILLLLIILPIPSISPALSSIDMPSMSRTIGILPFVYVLVAYGLLSIYQIIQKYTNPTLAKIFCIFLLFSITFLNLYKYFIQYPQGLPNHNSPFAKIIANYIRTLSKDTEVKFTSYGWGNWGQPEAQAIYYSTGPLTGRENILFSQTIHNCNQVGMKKNTILIFNPNERNTIFNFQQCFPQAMFKQYSVNNQHVFSSLLISPK